MKCRVCNTEDNAPSCFENEVRMTVSMDWRQTDHQGKCQVDKDLIVLDSTCEVCRDRLWGEIRKLLTLPPNESLVTMKGEDVRKVRAELAKPYYDMDVGEAQKLLPKDTSWIIPDETCPSCHADQPRHSEGCDYHEWLQSHPDGKTEEPGPYITNEDGMEWIHGHWSKEEALSRLVDMSGEVFGNPDYYEPPGHSFVHMRCLGRGLDLGWDEKWTKCSETDFGAEPFTQLEF